MPRLPVEKVIEHRITFGRIERELLQDVSTSYRIQALDIEGMLRILEDPWRVIQIAYGIATALEMIGIETGWPTAADAVEWFAERQRILDETKASVEAGGRSPSQWAEDLLNMLTGGVFGAAYQDLQDKVD